MSATSVAPAKVITRWQASGIHLLISIIIAAVALFVLLRVWYPPPFFMAEGGHELLFILIAVDVIIGPLITLIIFKVGKPSLRFDLTVIALLQACALIYGVYVMFVARPVYVVLAIDGFVTLRANDLEPEDLVQARDPAFRSLPLTGPQFVAVDIPKDMKEIGHIMAEAQQTGKVVTQLPKYFVAYAQHQKQALAQAQPLEPALRRGGDFATLAQQFLNESGRHATELKFLAVQMRRGYGAALLDAKTGEIVTLLPPKL